MRSLRVKIFIFLAALLIALLVLLNSYPLTAARDSIFEEKRSAMAGRASVISSSLSSLDSLTGESIGEVLTLLDVSGLERTLVTDATGLVLYDSGGRVGIVCELEDVIYALGGKERFRSSFADSAFSSSYAMPLSRNGTITGALYISEHDSERANIIIDVQTQLQTISFIITIFTMLVAVVFMYILLRRIRELARSMRTVATGRYDHRHTVRGHDEISELGTEFNQLTERLDKTEKQRRRFVADASHELKTPLASIRLLTDSILQNNSIDRDTVQEFVSDIGNEAERLQRTTEKLLDLSRLDDTGVQFVPEPVDIKLVAVDALIMLRPLANEMRVKIKCEMDDGCVVIATADDMFHIIFNLLENAMKYNVPEGLVLLRVYQDEEEVFLAVEDTGIGIPEEDRLNIFARFYRVDKARSREAGGSGLGLSIVHDTVLAHGGSITVGPNKPQGSKFTVSFPRPTSEETGI